MAVETGSSNNLARFIDNDIIPNLKIGSISKQQHLTCATMTNIFSTANVNVVADRKYLSLGYCKR